MIPGARNVTFYKRSLPCPPAREFSSPEGMALFQKAMSDGTMVGFFKLIEQYRTQTEPAYCGLTTLAMVLNALSIDPRRTWKAPWRWFDETLLDCCKALALVKVEGLVLDEVACLARCNGANVSIHPFGTFKLATFRELVKKTCRTSDQHLIVSYSRKTFLQTGDGHFSPIGGYHEEEDQVLILDTARFKYPPHWVPLETLFNSMGTIDPASNKPRGFLMLKAPDRPISMYYTLNRMEEYQAAELYIRQTGPERFRKKIEAGETLDEALKEVVRHCPRESVEKFVAIRVSTCCCAGGFSNIHSKQFREEFSSLPLYQEVEKYLAAETPLSDKDVHLVGRTTALLLLKPAETWPGLEEKSEALKTLIELMDISNPSFSLVKTEIEFLRHQLENLVAFEERQICCAAKHHHADHQCNGEKEAFC